MTFPLVRVGGDAFERGRTHGEALTARLRAFLDDGLARLGPLLDAPVTLDTLHPRLAQYRAAIETATPELATEIRGLAAGAGITEDEATLLQVRREILGYHRVPTQGDCTTYASVSGAEPVLAQTVDLNGDLDDHLAVLDVAAGPRRALVLSFGGLLGYLGINTDGLAVGLNLVVGGEWRPGLPPYLAIRHLLDTAGSVDEAIEVLAGLRLASSRSLTLCDTKTTAWVEVLGDEMRVARGAESFHTNHFLHPDLAPHDELNVFARNFSRLRLTTSRARVADLGRDASTEQHFGLLSAAPIRVEGTGDLRRERTVAAVVLWPGRGEMHVRPGDPASSSTRSFAFT